MKPRKSYNSESVDHLKSLLSIFGDQPRIYFLALFITQYFTTLSKFLLCLYDHIYKRKIPYFHHSKTIFLTFITISNKFKKLNLFYQFFFY